MKIHPLRTALLVVLATVILGVAGQLQPVLAQGEADAKISLMTEALRARDAGDLAGAQKALAQLEAISPNDPAVKKLSADIAAQSAAQKGAAAPVAPAPKPAATAAAAPTPAAAAAPSAAQLEAEALSREETARINRLIADGTDQLTLVRAHRRNGR